MKYHRFSSLLLVTLLILPRHGGTREKVTNDQKVWYGFHKEKKRWELMALEG